MKKAIKNTLFVLLLIFIIVFISSFIFVLIAGKTLIKERLGQVLKRDVNFSSVSLHLPLSLEIRGLEIPDFAQIDKIYISPVIVGFTRGRIILGRVSLIQPKFLIGKSSGGNWNLPEGILDELHGRNAHAKTGTMVSGLLVKDGNLKFTDESKSPAFSFNIKDINLEIGNKILSFNPVLTRFKVRAGIITQADKPVSILNATGWINFLRKDMKGMIELSDLDAVYFLPLYSKFMTSNLKNGILSFKSDIISKSNDLVANCRLAIKDLAFEKGKDETAPTISFFDIVAGGLQTENKEVNIDFLIKTKLDDPRIDVVKLSGSIIAKALGEQMIKSPEQTVEKFKSIGKQFEKLGKEILKDRLGIDVSSKKEEKVNTPEFTQPVTNAEALNP